MNNKQNVFRMKRKRDVPRPKLLQENWSPSYTPSSWQKSLRLLKFLWVLSNRVLFRLLSHGVIFFILRGRDFFRVLSDEVTLSLLSGKILFNILWDELLFKVLSGILNDKHFASIIIDRFLFWVFSRLFLACHYFSIQKIY